MPEQIVKEHTVISNKYVDYVNREINSAFRCGWFLWGNMFFADGQFHQAMVKYQKEPKK